MVQKKSNKRRDILILLAVLVIALVAYFLTRDRFTSLFSGGLDDPADDEENLYYSIEYEISSAHVLERGGIVVELPSAHTLVSCPQRESQPITRDFPPQK